MAIIQEIASPFLRLIYGFVDAVPGLIAAALIIVLGWLVGKLIHRVVTEILDRVRFDDWVLKHTSVNKTIGDFEFGRFLALVSKWYTFILFLPPAANVISLEPLQNFLLAVALWIPQAIVAVILGLIGVMAAEYAEMKVVETKAKRAGWVASASKAVILIFTVIVVLDQLGIRVDVAKDSFLVILAGVMVGLSLAFGIGFGLGMRDEAKKIVTNIRRKF
jgi:xanthosine utilization system XapX-like protein